MKQRAISPRKLDIGAFIDSGEPLAGDVPVADLPRLAAGLFAQADLATVPPVVWQAQGRLEKQRVGPAHRWLDLSAKGMFPWECQRCLHGVDLPIDVSRSIRFVDDEALAADLDADDDDDVLAASRQFDLLELIEDELIMAQPLIPRHENCPTDVARHMKSFDPEVSGDDSDTQVSGGKPNPFAVLATLKKNKS